MLNQICGQLNSAWDYKMNKKTGAVRSCLFYRFYGSISIQLSGNEGGYMLHLILGTAGTGKTTLLYQRICDCVKAGEKAILLVPEQSSFESEKALYRLLGPKDALAVEVLSFTRLSDRIFREFGGLAGIHLDETAKFLLMNVALEELGLGGGLKVYGKSSGNAAFISTMCQTISELKTAGADPDSLRTAAMQSGNTALTEKLKEIALIFEGYQAIIDRGYQDPDDSLTRACNRLEDEDFFGAYHVFIDGFMAFMGTEWKILQHILMKSKEITVALTCEGLDISDKTSAVAAVTSTANRFVQEAKKCGSRIAKPLILKQPHRFEHPDLAYIAENFLNEPHTLCDFSADQVLCTSCEDVYDELGYVAAQISILIQDQGYRFHDIAVIARNLERYLVPLQTVFARYDIPFFTDLRSDIQVYPLVSGLLCALEAVRSNFDSEYLLALSKQCITGIKEIEAGMLENYCYIWSISGSEWTHEFVNHPDGMQESLSNEQEKRLTALNSVRLKLISPLLRLKERIKDCDGRQFASAIFQYLTDCNAVQNLIESAECMPKEEQKHFLDRGTQVWDAIIGLLDAFGGALNGVYIPLARLIDLFRMSISTADIGTLPQTLDQVIVGTADRIRPNEPKAVFIIGLNEGEFPRWSEPSGIFSVTERTVLCNHGIDLLRSPEQTALFEKYYVYFALTQASEKLWLTCPLKDTAGKGLTPSHVFQEIEDMLGLKIQPDSNCAVERIFNEKTAFDVMTKNWRQQTAEQETLKYYFAEKAPQKLQALKDACEWKEYKITNPALAKKLFGDEIKISPSRIEKYYSCPFYYFCQSGLNLKPRRKVEFNPIESGSLIHVVLEQMVKKYGGAGLLDLKTELLQQEVSKIIHTYLSERILDLSSMSARFRYLFTRLVDTLVRLLKRLGEEFAQSQFEPVAFELPIRMDAEHKPLELFTPDGFRIVVEGVVDRVDVMKKDGIQYVRVVDYKSGSKEFKLSDVYYGLNMQMLIYLFSLCNYFEENNHVHNIPAGVLYMPAKDKVLSADRDTDEKAAKKAQRKQMKMNGILLENREVLSAMEADLAGIFIPAKTKKDGSFDAHSSLATLSQMGKIKGRVESLIKNLANELHKGNISAAPVDGISRYMPCKWCDYHAICAHEEGDAVRKITEMDRSAILELMRKDENNG